MMENNEEKQVIEVEYNKEMVAEDLQIQNANNEEELVQDTFNEDGIDELLGEGAIIDEYNKID